MLCGKGEGDFSWGDADESFPLAISTTARKSPGRARGGGGWALSEGREVRRAESSSCSADGVWDLLLPENSSSGGRLLSLPSEAKSQVCERTFTRGGLV